MRHLVSISLGVAGSAIAAWVVTGAKGLAIVGPADEWIGGALLLGSGAKIGGGLLASFRRTRLTWLGTLIGGGVASAPLVLIVMINSAFRHT
jgi:hypothetical protein